MMRKIAVTLIIGSMMSLSFAAEGTERRTFFGSESGAAHFRLQLREAFREKNITSFEIETKADTEKSVAKSFLFSVVVPGSGQLYTGSYLKGAAFFLLEIATIVGQIHFDNQAEDYERQFIALADAEWTESEYWDWIASVSGRDRQKLDGEGGLREWERQTFSHYLPEEKNQQYYENVGKYDQFIMGWDQFRNLILPTVLPGEAFTLDTYQARQIKGIALGDITPIRTRYVNIRKDSNDNFKRATTFATMTLFNHVISALDAGWTASKYNRRLKTSMHMQGMRYDTELIPALVLGVQW